MNSKSIVFIPQEPMRKNSEGRWVSKGLNLASATAFGELSIIWPPDNSILNGAMLEEEALRVAKRYREDKDYIVALGSPTLIGLLAWAIGREGKMLRVLEWDRGLQRYYATLGEPLFNEKG